MIILTTQDIANFPVKGSWFGSAKNVAKACRDGSLFGLKPSGNFQSWQIPADSLAYCIRYNPFFKEAFDAINMKELDPEMEKKVKAVKTCLNRKDAPHSEQYSISVLSKVFGVPMNQIVVMLCASEPIWRKMLYSLPGYAQSYAHGIPVGRIMNYLDKNPNWVDKLYERQQMLLANGDIADEAVARHILMLYAYYKDNGYLL